MKFTVNGQEHDLAGIDPDMPVLWVLRDKLNLTGTKYGCGVRSAGRARCTSTVRRSGRARCPRATPGRQENRHHRGSLRPRCRRRAFGLAKVDVAQCGYCQSGQIIGGQPALEHPKPTDADIDAAMNGNICRCGTYVRIRKAIHEAARSLAERPPS